MASLGHADSDPLTHLPCFSGFPVAVSDLCRGNRMPPRVVGSKRSRPAPYTETSRLSGRTVVLHTEDTRSVTSGSAECRFGTPECPASFHQVSFPPGRTVHTPTTFGSELRQRLARILARLALIPVSGLYCFRSSFAASRPVCVR
jgi:hypothetical protein